MNLEDIKYKLESNKYICTMYKNENLILVGDKENYDSDSKISFRVNFCSIKLENGLLNLEYSKGQIPIEKEFDSEDDLIKFIRKQFPLN